MADEEINPDLPGDEDIYELAVPFVVCQTAGGPFDDDAFVAGFQCGEIDRAMLVGASAGAQTIRFPMVRSTLLRQLELQAMNRGYPYVVATVSEEYPDWADVTFSTEEDRS